jgi:hypothetical protein
MANVSVRSNPCGPVMEHAKPAIERTGGDPCFVPARSGEWVRQRLVQAPEKLYKNGKRYKVPKGLAEEFVRFVFY